MKKAIFTLVTTIGLLSCGTSETVTSKNDSTKTQNDTTIVIKDSTAKNVDTLSVKK